MTTPIWQPGTLYAPGSLVTPRTPPSQVSTAITNPGFEDGTTDWTLGAATALDVGYGFAGNNSIEFTGTGGITTTVHSPYPVIAGKSITASCQYQQGAASAGGNPGAVILRWYDSGMTPISDSAGNIVSSGSGGAWLPSSVTAVAPAGAAFVAIGITVTRNASQSSWADQFVWNYAQAVAPLGLVFRAVQLEIGTSDSTEPDWPTTVGVQVVDNDVIWEGVLASRVTWEAIPILKSGAVEPIWPTVGGSNIADNTINWEAVSRRITDENCPNSKVVAILASKVFAVDKDLVRFSATTNAQDWTTPDNAGYLATGLQQANSNDMAVLNQYRGNLVAFNASSFQHWQVDPDPALMALLDQMEGIGSTWQHAAASVGDELLYLSQLGVRSVSMSAGANNLAAGDVGMPVDPLVQPAIAAAVVAGSVPVGTYYPSQGQYWLAFPDYPAAGETTCFVATFHGSKPKWSRYLFPFAIEAFAQLGNDLYVRNGDQVSLVSEDAIADQLEDTSQVEFGGTVWWPYLDFGQPGVTKMLEGFDIIASGSPEVSIGYDQRNLAAFTTPYALPADTIPGGMIGLCVTAPTMSVRVDFAPGEKWSLSGVTLFVSDDRVGV